MGDGNRNKTFHILYKINLWIVIISILASLIFGIAAFGVLLVLLGANLGATFLILNIWGIIKEKKDRLKYAVVALIAAGWVLWSLNWVNIGLVLP